MKVSVSVMAMISVIALTLGAAGYRVTTAHERMQLRLESARAACVASGQEWVTDGRETSCRPLAGAKKV